MNDKQIIQAAVELADGWRLVDKFGSYEIAFNVLSADSTNEFYFPMFLDALAAQLVRQVDATDYGITFNTDNECKTAVWGSHGFTPSVISSSFGPDRTMNTLRAIVESGVLSNG